MPKMTKAMAEEVKKAGEGSGDFGVVPPGTYIVRLTNCSVVPDKDPMQWKWEYTIPKSAEQHPGKKFWVRTSFSDNAKWKVDEQFAAFGVDPTTDTDEIIGRPAKLLVELGTVPPGYASSGQETNNVKRTMACTEAEYEEAYGKGDDADLDRAFGAEDEDEDEDIV